MHVPPLLTDLVLLLGVSLGVVYLSHLVRLPPVVGFLATGVLLGPHGLAVVHGIHEVEQLAEFGVILVLFAIGLEFSLAELMRMRRFVLVGGSVQVLGTMAVVTGLLAAVDVAPGRAVFVGMIAALSSTAVVLRLLQQRAEIDAVHGRLSLGVLVYQDLMIVPMMLLLPVLAGTGGSLGAAVAALLGKAVGVLAAVGILAVFVVPRLLERIVATRSRDMFLLTVVGICLAVAWAAAGAGLSLALGAFLAGLIISESEYSHQALSDILPFRDLFAAFFFISIGMLLDVGRALETPLLVAGLVAGTVGLKAVIAGAAALALGLGVRTAVLVGLGLGQVGEFSFILAGTGVELGLLGDAAYNLFLVTAVASIGVTPFLFMVAPWVADRVGSLPLPGSGRRWDPEGGEPHPELHDHVIVIGHGINGSSVARAAAVARIPYTVLELNPAVVSDERERGVEIHYGDATQPATLERAGIVRARVLVVAIADAAATRRIVALARGLAPACLIVARTRYMREVAPLQVAGADRVVPEELETSLEIVARVLNAYLVPRRDIESFVDGLRADGYEMLRSTHLADPTLADLDVSLSEFNVTTLRVDPGAPVVGRALGETDLRRVHGLSVVAIRRGSETVPNPGGETVVEAGDQLIVTGLGEEVSAASSLFRAATTGPGS